MGTFNCDRTTCIKPRFLRMSGVPSWRVELSWDVTPFIAEIHLERAGFSSWVWRNSINDPEASQETSIHVTRRSLFIRNSSCLRGNLTATLPSQYKTPSFLPRRGYHVFHMWPPSIASYTRFGLVPLALSILTRSAIRLCWLLNYKVSPPIDVVILPLLATNRVIGKHHMARFTFSFDKASCPYPEVKAKGWRKKLKNNKWYMKLWSIKNTQRKVRFNEIPGWQVTKTVWQSFDLFGASRKGLEEEKPRAFAHTKRKKELEWRFYSDSSSFDGVVFWNFESKSSSWVEVVVLFGFGSGKWKMMMLHDPMKKKSDIPVQFSARK